jgi:UDP-glucuronate 4-epimerase
VRVLITGVAGFIGMHSALRILRRGDEVVGLDNLNDYYDVSLKQSRLNQLLTYKNFQFKHLDICDLQNLKELFQEFKPHRVLHLAAQAGVRYSIDHPDVYVKSNLEGFLNILECVRNSDVDHLVYASSSSVYGGNTTYPFKEAHAVDHPVSFYAATKKSNELMAHTYSHLYKIPTTGLRFFTVYGPWGRPDMAPYKFLKALHFGNPIDVYNHGDMKRDFTYIDDIVNGVVLVLDKQASPEANFDPSSPVPHQSNAPYRVFNIGNNQPVNLMTFIEVIENYWGKKFQKNFMPIQPGDVPVTYANTDALNAWVGFQPDTSIYIGVENFVEWYKKYNGV